MKPLPGLVLNSGAATFEPVSDSQRPMLGLDQMGETSLAFLKNTDLSARLAGRRANTGPRTGFVNALLV